jgi:hypothetical protein
MAPPKASKSQETCLISAVTERCNVRIRPERMDIKVLIAEDRGLEQ